MRNHQQPNSRSVLCRTLLAAALAVSLAGCEDGATGTDSGGYTANDSGGSTGDDAAASPDTQPAYDLGVSLDTADTFSWATPDTGGVRWDGMQQDSIAPDSAQVCRPVTAECGAPNTPPCAPGDRCKAKYGGTGDRGWPVATNASGPLVNGVAGCKDSNGKTWPSVGAGSATWFQYNKCGTYKDFAIGTHCTMAIVSYNDCCSGCVLKNIEFDVQEKVGTSWKTMRHIKHPFTGTCASYTDRYTPQSGVVRIKMTTGFYVCAYQE